MANQRRISPLPLATPLHAAPDDPSGAGRGARLWRLLLPWALAFAVAFAGDRLTGQRWSSFWGSGAIVVSLLVTIPAARGFALAVGAFGGTWLGFNLLRALAGQTPFALAGPDAVARLDEAMGGGLAGSARWQAARLGALRAGDVTWLDQALTLVHFSFFVVPFVVALATWLRNRPLFWRLTLATAITFALALPGFFLLPAAPPWMHDPLAVVRIPHLVLAQWGVMDGSANADYAFEPNAMAAFPSVHVAATVLVLLAAWGATHDGGSFSRWLVRGAALLYALAMSVGVIWLGEHYLVDVIGGWAVALAGWWLASRLWPRTSAPADEAAEGGSTPPAVHAL
ncbi:MAG: phosphatase PAP2 family protein [Thermomicrobiales bacterium]